jgi:hypothetical protein
MHTSRRSTTSHPLTPSREATTTEELELNTVSPTVDRTPRSLPIDALEDDPNNNVDDRGLYPDTAQIDADIKSVLSTTNQGQLLALLAIEQLRELYKFAHRRGKDSVAPVTLNNDNCTVPITGNQCFTLEFHSLMGLPADTPLNMVTCDHASAIQDTDLAKNCIFDSDDDDASTQDRESTKIATRNTVAMGTESTQSTAPSRRTVVSHVPRHRKDLELVMRCYNNNSSNNNSTIVNQMDGDTAHLNNSTELGRKGGGGRSSPSPLPSPTVVTRHGKDLGVARMLYNKNNNTTIVNQMDDDTDHQNNNPLRTNTELGRGGALPPNGHRSRTGVTKRRPKKRNRRPDAVVLVPVTPTENDVKIGRGRASNSHPGNIALRRCADLYRVRYHQTQQKGSKADYCIHVVNLIRKEGGRFIKEYNGNWFEVPNQHACTKVSQLFRERPRLAN